MNSIPSDERQYAKLLGKVSLRYLSSTSFHSDVYDKCRRMERWWERKSDAQGDEYHAPLSYAFSIVERMHAKTTEPLFQMGLPCDTYPRNLGDFGAAKKMQHIQRAHYGKPNFQEGLSSSKKSMCVVGHRWEFDEWLRIVRKGKAWGQVPQKVEVPIARRSDGTPDGDKTAMAVTMVMAEVPVDRLVHCGFNTEWPRWDQVHPEPDRTTIDTGQKTDMTWIIRDLGYLTIESLAKEVEYDPNAKANVPRYDFSKLLHKAGSSAEKRYKDIMDGKDGSADNFGTMITPQRSWDYQAGRRSSGGDSRTEQANALEDRDKIWVVQHREMGEILTIAQGAFIIHRQPDPWHVPGLKARIENYTTPATGKLHGPGAIEPVETELGEMEDMHSMSMDNIFRIVHRMTYVRQDAIVSEDDFDARAGGLVRIKSDVTDVRAAVQEAQQSSPVNEMLAVESDLRGLIEFSTMELDGSPGVSGTKQAHKTKGGMDQIVSNMTPSYSRWQRQARINECRRCMNMADMFEQFAFEKQSYRLVRADGSTSFAEFDRTDIATDGRGFDFGYNMDPAWGNPQQRLAMKQGVYKAGIEYMSLDKKIRGENSREVVLDVLFEDILQDIGYTDTSAIFRLPDGSMSPEEELERLAQGGVVDGCKGDLMHHIQMHFLQLNSPGLKAAIQAQKANPDTAKNLQLLIMQAMAALKTFAANPQGAAMAKMGQAGMVLPGPQANPGAKP